MRRPTWQNVTCFANGIPFTSKIGQDKNTVSNTIKFHLNTFNSLRFSRDYISIKIQTVQNAINHVLQKHHYPLCRRHPYESVYLDHDGNSRSDCAHLQRNKRWQQIRVEKHHVLQDRSRTVVYYDEEQRRESS